MSSVRSRVLAGLGANASGQLVTIVIQLASVPVFLHFWSVEEYGRWLLMSALPGYLSLADLGLGTVAMNRMVMLRARGRENEARVVFQSALLMTGIMLAGLLLVAWVIIWLLPVAMLEQPGARTTMMLLILVALLNVLSGLFDAVFRSSGQFAAGTYLINCGRLAEWLGGLGALLVFGSMFSVAAGFLTARLLTTLLFWLLATIRFPAYPWRISEASRRELNQMVRPALSFLSFPLGNALTIQGMSVVVGTTLGPTALAVFNTYRTLSRLPIQMLATFTRALWPEISRSFGDGDHAMLRRMYRRGTLVSLILCAAASVGLFVGADRLLAFWTGNRISMQPTLLLLLLLTAFANCAWQVGQVVLTATNQHERLALVYLLAAICSIGMAVLIPASWGLNGMVIAIGSFEIVLLLVSHRQVSRIVSVD